MRPLFALLLLVTILTASAENWPAWRGSTGDGLSREKNLPLHWSATENIRWKVALPEPGNSTPIVWAKKVFLTQARAKDGHRGILCLDRGDGHTLWEKWIPWSEKEESHESNPLCSCSPVTDGERVIALLGSPGLFCWDLDGKEIWRKDLGRLEHIWGYGASPVIHGDEVIVNFGPGKRSLLVALDKKTGKTRWQVDIPEEKPAKRTDGFQGEEAKGVVGSWSTPIVVNSGTQEEIIFPFNGRLRAFHPATGRELWSCGGLTPLFYASPMASGDIVFLASGYRGNALAVRAGGAGDVTESRRLWHEEGAKSGIGTGVAHHEHFYYHAGSIGICREVKTGKIVWEERLRGSGSNADSWSSLLLAGDIIYAPNQNGDVVVFRASPTFETIGVNSIGTERCNASLAASDGQFFLRTHNHLWCVGK
ncbi:MAG: PQQ-binding-like beta-propeller repeat protein [Verrucomicrobiales bacterium]